MGQRDQTYQVHANANIEGRDMALRVTVTAYDEAGGMEGTRTWRKHVTAPQMDDLKWVGAMATINLYKLMSTAIEGIEELEAELNEPDVPLF